MSAEKFRVEDQARRQRLAQRYPDSWQRLCRDILLLYAKVASDKPSGNPIGAPTLRKRIMRDEDAHHPKGLDERLPVGQLSDWLRAKTKKLDETQFSFVDKFIHSLPLNTEIYRPIREELYRHAADNLRRSFAKIYLSKSVYSSSVVPENLKYLTNTTYVCKVLSGWNWTTPVSGRSRRLDFTQIALYFHDFRMGMFAVNGVYSKIPFWNLIGEKRIQPRDTVEYFGFLIPFSSDGPNHSDGVLHLTKKGTEGISDIGPLTISSFLLHEEHDGYELETSWVPQIILPTIKHFNEPNPYWPPDLSLVPPESDRRGDPMISKTGTLIFVQIHADYEFVTEYLSSLTNEYVIW